MAERNVARSTDRFEKKRDAILDASTVILNTQGVKGLGDGPADATGRAGHQGGFACKIEHGLGLPIQICHPGRRAGTAGHAGACRGPGPARSALVRDDGH